MKKLQLRDHFSLVERIEPNTQVCMIDNNGIKERINVWQVNSLGRWVDKKEFSSLEDFEQNHSKLKYWKNIVLTNGESLAVYYKDAANLYDTAYIVEPKHTFYDYNEKKPTLFSNYYIKDEFVDLRAKLPELKDIF
jgi:hypothetical protein